MKEFLNKSMGSISNQASKSWESVKNGGKNAFKNPDPGTLFDAGMNVPLQAFGFMVGSTIGVTRNALGSLFGTALNVGIGSAKFAGKAVSNNLPIPVPKIRS